jgi:hypothetical protein
VRYAVLVLAMVTGACNSPFKISLGPFAELTNVKVSPPVVRVGDQFVASATVVLHDGCTAANDWEFYGSEAGNQFGTSVSQSFTAAPDQTVVTFTTTCTSPKHQSVFGSGPDDSKNVTIGVLPAQ